MYCIFVCGNLYFFGCRINLRNKNKMSTKKNRLPHSKSSCPPTRSSCREFPIVSEIGRGSVLKVGIVTRGSKPGFAPTKRHCSAPAGFLFTTDYEFMSRLLSRKLPPRDVITGGAKCRVWLVLRCQHDLRHGFCAVTKIVVWTNIQT